MACMLECFVGKEKKKLVREIEIVWNSKCHAYGEKTTHHRTMTSIDIENVLSNHLQRAGANERERERARESGIKSKAHIGFETFPLA